MNFLKKSIRKYWKPPQTHDVTELAKKPDVASEIEKALWELKGVLGLDTEEIENSIYSLRISKHRRNSK
jgi:hypothetical protein